MKKFLFLIFIFLSFTSLAQTVFTESFDNTTFVPSGWSIVTTSNSATWARVTTSAHPTGIIPRSGAGMARFNSWTFSSGIQSMVSPRFDLSGRGTNSAIVRFWIYRESGFSTSADRIDIMVNTNPTPVGATILGTVNRSRTLSPSVPLNGWYQYSYNIPLSFSGNSNYLIIRATSAFGNDIHVDDIQWTEYKRPCSGIPTAGIISGPQNVCLNTNFNLSLVGQTTDPGIQYQWQSKPITSTIWTNISGATSSILTTSINSYTDFRCIVTCINSNQSVYTNQYTVSIGTTANLPLVVNDSVCFGQTAVVYPYYKDTTVNYNWYTSTSTTTPFFIGDSLKIPNVQRDTIFYVNSVSKSSNICTSPKVPVFVFASYSIKVNLGSDINICQTPIILDAGHFGASSYLWNTGETTQYITIKNSGTYWVQVDKYCKDSDTVDVLFDLPASCEGISYSRIGNDFIFTAAGATLTKQYTWIFSDSTAYYSSSVIKKINKTTKVDLYVSNDCGGMKTTLTLHPTSIQNNSLKEIEIYPNPVKDILYIKNISQNNTIVIKDCFGRKVKQFENVKELNISDIATGHYILHITSDNIQYTTKIIKGY